MSNAASGADIAKLGLSRKTFDIEFKSEGDAGSFTLYCACFGNVDLGGDVIEPGAFRNLEQFVVNGFGLVNHVSSSLPVAWVDTAVQDSIGLKVTGRFHTTPEAQACRTVVLERMAAKKAVKCSLGYVALEESFEKLDGATVRHIHALDVYEFSFVGVPMNPLAGVQSAKALDTIEQETGQMKKDAAVIKAIKQALGLRTKASYKVDGEDMERVKGLVEKCATSAKNLDDMHKSMKGFIDAHKAATDELTKCVKNFHSGTPQVAAADDDGNVADKPKDDDDEGDKDDVDADEDEDKPPDKPGKKPPADEEDEDAKTAKAYRATLKQRALMGRSSQLCP